MPITDREGTETENKMLKLSLEQLRQIHLMLVNYDIQRGKVPPKLPDETRIQRGTIRAQFAFCA